MKYPNNSESEMDSKLSLEELQKFLELLSRLTPQQREALKKVLESFT